MTVTTRLSRARESPGINPASSPAYAADCHQRVGRRPQRPPAPPAPHAPPLLPLAGDHAHRQRRHRSRAVRGTCRRRTRGLPDLRQQARPARPHPHRASCRRSRAAAWGRRSSDSRSIRLANAASRSSRPARTSRRISTGIRRTTTSSSGAAGLAEATIKGTIRVGVSRRPVRWTSPRLASADPWQDMERATRYASG